MSAVRWPHGPRCRVCVSLAEPTVERLLHVLAGIDDATGALPDLIEIRLDALHDHRPLAGGLIEELAAHAPLPVGFTLRPRGPGGGFEGDEAQRRVLLERAARAGAAFVDVELAADWAADFVAGSPAPVVLSHHWESPGVPPDLAQRVAQARAHAPAVIKLVATAVATDDAVPLLTAGAAMIADGQPAACFCMGEAGRASRLLAAARGGALIYAAVGAGCEVAPGQWAVRELLHDLRLPSWQPDATLYGLIGDPIGHSLSPAIFNAVFEDLGVAAAYLPFPGADLDAVLRLIEAMEVRGVSVTMPFKQQMAARSSQREPLVETTGAANTVAFGPGGWSAWNTDGQAVVDALLDVREVVDARVVLVGAGGAARAAAVALAGAGAELTVLNRTVAHAEQVAGLAGAAWGPIERLQQEHFDVVINATPVGMAGGPAPEATPFPPAWLAGKEVVFDMVYRPRRTPLLKQAGARGCAVVEGLEMFVRQAAAQYRLLTGDRTEAPLATMRATLARVLGEDTLAAQDPGAGGTGRG
jgi:3-dehydroquinate dehydratase/shikimate dehydrogenase